MTAGPRLSVCLVIICLRGLPFPVLVRRTPSPLRGGCSCSFGPRALSWPWDECLAGATGTARSEGTARSSSCPSASCGTKKSEEAAPGHPGTVPFSSPNPPPSPPNGQTVTSEHTPPHPLLSVAHLCTDLAVKPHFA